MASHIHCQFQALAGLDVYTRPLSIEDVKSCVSVESAFPEQERCFEEKFLYRLTHTPELCLGLFIRSNNTETLIAHVIAIRSSAAKITDGSMQMPKEWRSLSSSDTVLVNDEVIGNDARGSSIAIHSVAVLPEYQGNGTGVALVKAYIEYLRNQNIPAEQIILICHDYLIRFYERAGFRNLGKSECRFGGGAWFDMSLDL